MGHPGLLHLYVHLMEMSPFPEAALVTGDRLRELTPDMGHLTHMPTHIDIQCGHYRDAMHWNQRRSCRPQVLRPRRADEFLLGLCIHNYHFAVYGAMFLGSTRPHRRRRRVDRDDAGGDAAHSSPPMADFLEGYVPFVSTC